MPFGRPSRRSDPTARRCQRGQGEASCPLLFLVTRRAILLVCFLVPLAAGAASPEQDRTTAPPSETVRVTGVHDGDTIVVKRHGRPVTVRLIGVDTPETGRPDTPVQFFGPEASGHTRRSLLGKTVRLAFEPPDRQGGSVDKYGRLLAYVLTEDGRNFNLELVRLGFGRAYTRYPFSLQREFQAAEHEARSAGTGIWDAERRAAWSDPRTRGQVIGNTRSRIYHLPGQQGYDDVLEKNRVYFTDEEDAVRAGFRKARR